MSNFCSTPIQPGDTRYVNGLGCTWHGPIALADERVQPADVSSHGEEPQSFDALVPCCPKCRGALMESPTEEFFWSMVRNQERNAPGYEAMLRWSKGKCFPDFDTLQNAYRQAMEGQS